MSDAGDRVVHVIPKADGSEIRATLNRFRGSLYVHLRLYCRADSGDGCPTKRGVSLPADGLDELNAVVKALRAAVDAAPGKRPDRIQRYTQSRRGD